MLLSIVPAAPEFFFRKPPPTARKPGTASPDPLNYQTQKPPGKVLLLTFAGVHIGVKFRSGSMVWRSISHRVKAPALQAQSPRTARGQI
jgi:hypothetical protein